MDPIKNLQNKDEDERPSKEDIETSKIELQNQNKGKKSKKSEEEADKKKNNDPEANSKNEAKSEPEINSQSNIPMKTSIYLLGSGFSDVSNSTSLNLKSDTNLRYLGAGMRLISELQSQIPRGYLISLRIGMPIFKQSYQFPVYRSMESEYFFSKIHTDFQVFAGLDYTPIYFVSLPGFGENLQVFENDFLWAKIGGGYNTVIKDIPVFAKFNFFQSLMMKSNQKLTYSGTRLSVILGFQHSPKVSYELLYHQFYLDGDIYTESKGLQLTYVYKLEN